MTVDENGGSCEFTIRIGRLPNCTHECKGCMFYNDPELLDISHEECASMEGIG